MYNNAIYQYKLKAMVITLKPVNLLGGYVLKKITFVSLILSLGLLGMGCVANTKVTPAGQGQQSDPTLRIQIYYSSGRIDRIDSTETGEFIYRNTSSVNPS